MSTNQPSHREAFGSVLAGLLGCLMPSRARAAVPSDDIPFTATTTVCESSVAEDFTMTVCSFDSAVDLASYPIASTHYSQTYYV